MPKKQSKSRPLKNLRQRGLAKPSRSRIYFSRESWTDETGSHEKVVEKFTRKGFPRGSVQITPKGYLRLLKLLGLSKIDIALGKSKFNTHYLIGASLRRFLGKRLSGKRILELGAAELRSEFDPTFSAFKGKGEGAGILLVQLARMGADSYGFDNRGIYVPETITKNQRLKNRVHTERGNLSNLGDHFTGKRFDAIVANNTLETDIMTKDDGTVLNNIKAKLKVGGYLISTAVSSEHIFTNEQLAKAGFRVIFRDMIWRTPKSFTYKQERKFEYKHWSSIQSLLIAVYVGLPQQAR